MSSDFDSLNYNPSGHLQLLLQTPESLKELPSLLQYIHTYKRQLDTSINKSIEDYDTYVDKAPKPQDLKVHASALLTDIKGIKTQTASAEHQITNISHNIQKLDQTKKNLVLSMTMVKRLQMLIEANDSLASRLFSKDYREILSLFSVVKELASHFKPYKSIDEVVTLNNIIKRTQNKLVDDIFFDYEEVISGNLDLEMSYGGEILELVSPDNKDKLVDWFCNDQLNEIKNIFKSSDEAGSLENVSRRYIFFMKVLKAVQTKYVKHFPSDWKIDVLLAKKFCEFTKKDLENVLILYYKNKKNTDPVVLLNALTATLEFEKTLGETLNTDQFDQAISHCFEPYLSVWISQQDSILNSKFIEYLASPKIPEEISPIKDTEELIKILESGNVPPNIASSCTELFRGFRQVLSQTCKLSSGPILLELVNLFSKYLKQFAESVLLPCIPNMNGNNIEDESLLTGIESFKYLSMVLNTADYCQNMIDQLESKMKQSIDPDLAESISFEDAREYFIQLITRCITVLLIKLAKDLEFIWRQFQNVNWDDMSSPGDPLRYIEDCEITVGNTIKIVNCLIIREGYSRNFDNKVIELVINLFMNQWKKIKPGISPTNAEQLIVDLEDLKKYLLELEFEEKARSYSKFIEVQFQKAETVLKLLAQPIKPIDDFVANYFTLIGDGNQMNFIKILELKGIADTTAYIDNFNLQIATGNHKLEEASSLLTSLKTESEEAAEKVRKPVATRSFPVIKSPRHNGTFSPSNNLNISNIEKGFRELALNSENKVNKMGENFKNFGKFFRKD